MSQIVDILRQTADQVQTDAFRTSGLEDKMLTQAEGGLYELVIPVADIEIVLPIWNYLRDKGFQLDSLMCGGISIGWGERGGQT